MLPDLSYGFKGCLPLGHNWYSSVFLPLAMEGSVAFRNLVLAQAAIVQAQVKGKVETPLSLEYRERVSKMLLEHSDSFSDDHSDAIIAVLPSATVLEDSDTRVKQRQLAQLNWDAAAHKIRERGGPATPTSAEKFRMLIIWSDYMFSGPSSCGMASSSTRNLSHSASDKEYMIARQEVEEECEEFITFFDVQNTLRWSKRECKGIVWHVSTSRCDTLYFSLDSHRISNLQVQMGSGKPGRAISSRLSHH
jgi:hypothetical protein